jgi:hypothetical protein
LRAVALVISRTLVPGIEGSQLGAMLRDVFRKSKNTCFVVEELRQPIMAMMEQYSQGGCAMVSIVPKLRKYKRKQDAYLARAVEMAEASQECFAFHDLADWTNSSVMIAAAFKEMHPEYLLATYLVIDGAVIEVTLDEMKRRSGFL